MNFYDLKATAMNGKEVGMNEYKDRIVLVVNTASKCGFTPQFKELEELYQKYKDQGLVILGFPCNQFGQQDPGNNEEINEFCQINYGVTFDMFEKIEVNGKGEHPIYNYLKSNSKGLLGNDIKWNFTKFLLDREGNVVKRFAPTVKPLELSKYIEKFL